MAIAINDNITRNLYTAAAGQTVFTVNFPFVDETYLQVFQRISSATPNNTLDLLTLGSEYSVSGAGNEAGGTITLVTPAGNGDIIAIVGTEPVDRLSVFQDLNPLTVSLNQQLNELTIMSKQIESIATDLTPKYRYDELISYEVRELNLELPILNDGDFWVGRGNFGDTPDDIITMNIADFPGGGGGGGGGTECCEKVIAQDTGTLFKGAWLKFTPGSNLYELAQANNATNADVVGLCANIINPNSFTMQQSGYNETTFTGLTTGNYFLSATVAGAMSLSPPNNDDEVSVPVFAADSATTGWVRNFRGKILGDDGSGSDTGDGDNQVIVTQVAHGFAVEEALYIDSAGHYDKAIATSFVESQVAGIVVEVIDADTFVLQQAGWSTKFTAKTAASLYWLSDATPGLITLTKPTDTTSFLRQCFNSYTTTSGWILEQVQLEGTEDASVEITQVGHAFTVGQFVRPSTATDGEWALAQADSVANATGVWMVIEVDGNDFWIQQSGITDKIAVLAGSATGDRAYLSATSAGDATLTEPTTTGQVSLPLYRLTDNSTAPLRTGELLNYRPMLQPNANGGTASGQWDLLANQTINGTASFLDFATVFADNPTITEVEIVFYNSTYTTLYLPGNVIAQFYVGGVLQTSGYLSTHSRVSFSSSPSNPSIFTGCHMVPYEALASGTCDGNLKITQPSVNGIIKMAWGEASQRTGFTASNNLLYRTHGILNTGTSPIEGFRVTTQVPSGRVIYGTYKVYGR